MHIKSFKTELKPNNIQATLFSKHAGCARFAYNWGLSTLKTDYDKRISDQNLHIEERKNSGLPNYSDKELKEYRKSVSKNYIQPSAMTLHKMLIEKKDKIYPFLKEVSKCAPEHALFSLEDAYKRFFKAQNKFPKFKKKNIHNSFTLRGTVIVGDSWIKLPRIGKIRLLENKYIPDGRPKSATISKRAGRWFVSALYEVDDIQNKKHTKEVLGVDLGIKSLMVCSDGTTINNSTKLKQLEESLKRLQRKISRQIKGSKSREKTKLKIQNLHFRISNSRQDIIHKATNLLTKTKPEEFIVIEDLNVKGMMKNHKLAKAISNSGWGEFKRQIEYKSKWNGKTVIVADRFFPSSKTDHKTGEYIKDLKLSDRVICHADGSKTDRDLNAAINLKYYGERFLKLSTDGQSGINASGEDRFIAVLKQGALR